MVNAQDIRSNRDFNIYVIEFPKLFKTTAETVPFLIIETMVAYKPYPVTNKKVNSFLLNYLMSFTEGQTLIKKYELFPFTMLVQTMERTFIDKLFALCDYHLRQNYDCYSRHLYDIHMMWTSEQLDKEKLMFIIPDIIAARQRFPKQNLSALPNSKPKTLLMEIIKTAVFKNDYNNVTLNLIHKKVNYET